MYLLSLLYDVDHILEVTCVTAKTYITYRPYSYYYIIHTTRWHKDEAESGWLRHATEDAKSDDKGRRGGKGKGSRIDTAVDECRNEMVDRVTKYRFDQ